MRQEDLNEARTNPDFLKHLEEARLNSIKTKNLELMYEIFNSMLILDLNEDNNINLFFNEIIKVATENLQNSLKDNRYLSFDSDFFTIRAFYELAIEKWSVNSFDLAKALFVTLAKRVDDEFFAKNIEVLIISLSKELDFEEFYEKYVDKNELGASEKYAYFITSFNLEVDDFLKENRDILEKEYKELESLISELKI